MSSTDYRRYRRMKKKEDEAIKKKKLSDDEMLLEIPTPYDVQTYIDNKVLELKMKDDGMQLQEE